MGETGSCAGHWESLSAAAHLDHKRCPGRSLRGFEPVQPQRTQHQHTVDTLIGPGVELQAFCTFASSCGSTMACCKCQVPRTTLACMVELKKARFRIPSQTSHRKPEGQSQKRQTSRKPPKMKSQANRKLKNNHSAKQAAGNSVALQSKRL